MVVLRRGERKKLAEEADLGYNIGMDFSKGGINTGASGLSPEERRRKTAQDIARKKVVAAFSSSSRSKTAGFSGFNVKNEQKTQNEQKTRKITVEETGGTKAVATGVVSEEWKRYHKAWQEYYQKYYSDYYTKAAAQYIAKEKLKAQRMAEDKKRKAESAIILSPEEVREKEVAGGLRERVRAISEREQKKRRINRKFVPLIAGMAIVLLLLFLQYNRMIFAPVIAYVSPGNTEDAGITAVDPTVSVAISEDSRLLIPKLNIDVPVHLGISNDTATVMDAMNNGVAQFSVPGASAMPGEIGNLAISGHSAGDIYSNNQYKFIFSGLERLEDGDLIYLDYGGVRYTYSVVGKKTVDPSDVAALVYEGDKPMLTLITCWPLGVSTYRLLVSAEQINPAPSGAVQVEVVDEGEGTSESMPKNEPTFFEGIWNWLTGQS